MQLCSSLSILWHCLSLGLEWKLTFSSPVATDECSKFAGILSVALSQHHLLGFEIAHLNSTPPLALFVVMLPKAHLTSHSRMSSSRWLNHTIMIIWVVKIFSVLFCVFLPPLNIVCFCLVHTISVLYWTHLCMKCSLGISNLSLSFYYFPLFLCTDHWGRPSYLSLLFFGTLHSNIFPFSFAFCFSSFQSYL